MSKLPILKPREVVALLGRLGFVEVRQRGSHQQFRHPDGRGTTVPLHKGRDISPALLRQIAKDIGVVVEDFVAGHPGQPPNPALQPSAGESSTTNKSPEPGRG